MAGRCVLYYITDRTQFPGTEAARRRALLAKIAEAAAAGVDFIQLREKDLSGRALESLARDAMLAIGKSLPTTHHQPLTTRLLINSRTDIAMAVAADGVSLRADDISPAEVRRLWSLCREGTPARERPVIGVSCHSREDGLRAESEGADFAVFAPVFGKQGSPPAGIAALQEACRGKIPVLALGGVTLGNAARCLAAGAAGIAAIRLFQDNKIGEVVRVLRSARKNPA